jgi:hypothetical protein
MTRLPAGAVMSPAITHVADTVFAVTFRFGGAHAD